MSRLGAHCTFRDSGLYLAGNAGTHSCALGDLDADGDLDVFVPDYIGASTAVWLN